MKITFISHASILIDVGGVTILSDPWWRGPCFGAQWWNYPAPYLDALEDVHIDYIYISHGHHDHFHSGTLRTLSRSAKVVISSATNLAPAIKELGFEVIELGDDEEFALGPEGAKCRIIETYSDDTLMAVTDGQEVCVNLNDALHSAPRAVQVHFIERLRRLFPRIDYVFCGYGVASHFPNCYVIPGKDNKATAARRQQYFNRQWSTIIAELRPTFGFPFAADVVFLEEDLFWVNEPSHNSERPTEAFRTLYPDSPVATIDIAPGFVIQNGHVIGESTRKPLVASDLSSAFADQIIRANRHGRVSESGVNEVAALIQNKLEVCSGYLKSYEGNYRFLIRFRNSQFGIRVEKRGENLNLNAVQIKAADAFGYDVVYTTRLPYLKWSLTKPYGDEILFVGSGGIFEYSEWPTAKQNLHREFMHLLKRGDGPPQPRYGVSSKIIYNAKKAIKHLIGRNEQDLYDLSKWTALYRSAPRRQQH